MADYIVHASVRHIDNGYESWIQLPAFILPGRILGIVNKDHARVIAADMLSKVNPNAYRRIVVSIYDPGE